MEQWKKYGKLIIAFDYDDTVHPYKIKGSIHNQIVDLLRRCKNLNFELIVFTCRRKDEEQEMINFLVTHNIPFDNINDNANACNIETGRKIYYNILLDDRAGLWSAYQILLKTITLIENKTKLLKEKALNL